VRVATMNRYQAEDTIAMGGVDSRQGTHDWIVRTVLGNNYSG
jgi:hypothetical protein